MITGHVARHLDDLPDKPRLGIYLMLVGLAVVGVWMGWPRLAAVSFQKASAGLAGFLPTYSLSEVLLYAGLICFAGGAFIFFRRGVWRLQERRDEKSITHLQFK